METEETNSRVVMCSADPEDEEVQRFIQYIKQLQNKEQ